MVHLMEVDGTLVPTDPELISVVRADRNRGGVEHARRLHAESCETYQRAARRAALATEMKRFTAREARRGRGGSGL